MRDVLQAYCLGVGEDDVVDPLAPCSDGSADGSYRPLPNLWKASVSSKPFKVCGCGLEHSEDEWKGLPSAGIQETSDDERVFYLELRTCTCGSTIGVETSSPVQNTGS